MRREERSLHAVAVTFRCPLLAVATGEPEAYTKRNPEGAGSETKGAGSESL